VDGLILERFLGALRVVYGNSRRQAKLIPKAMAKAKLGMQIPLFYFLPFFHFPSFPFSGLNQNVFA
jgi:hypothetical protein